jgi:predicted  nucleic acid-binding Zn-ribbon protein
MENEQKENIQEEKPEFEKKLEEIRAENERLEKNLSELKQLKAYDALSGKTENPLPEKKDEEPTPERIKEELNKIGW